MCGIMEPGMNICNDDKGASRKTPLALATSAFLPPQIHLGILCD